MSPFQQAISNSVCKPAKVRAHDDHLAVVEATVPAAGGAGEQHAVLPHDAEHPLVVDNRLTRPAQFSVGQRRDAAIAVGWALTDQELMPNRLDVTRTYRLHKIFTIF